MNLGNKEKKDAKKVMEKESLFLKVQKTEPERPKDRVYRDNFFNMFSFG